MSRTLSERLRWMLADFENLGVNEMTANLPAIRDAIYLARRVEGAASGLIKLDHLGHSLAVGVVRAEYDSDEDSEEYHRWVEIEDGQRVALVQVEEPPSTDGGEDEN